MQRSVRKPASADLGSACCDVLREVCTRLGAAGHRAWIVGGAVRDLALGEVPKDLDLASAATPEEVERVFERTIPVGRAFGTVVVLVGGRELQHTTFRTEAGYSDHRRPDQVAYGSTLQEDAARRDFTCNALYLDPLTDELADPEGGLADLAAGVLRAVGKPEQRFREDGLRLLRMARFAARLDAGVAPEVLAAARAEAASLAGVSPERSLGELERIFTGPRAHIALRMLVEHGLLLPVLPAAGWALDRARAEPRMAWLERLAEGAAPAGPGLASGLALLLEPERPGRAAFERAEAALQSLPLPRLTQRAVLARWRLLTTLEALLGAGVQTRAARVRLVRDAEWPATAALARARLLALGEDPVALEELEAFAAALAPGDRSPPPLLDAADLAAANIPAGPRYGTLLAELEELQLDQRLRTREEARAWLARRANQS